MQFLDYTLPTTAENLALDEALLINSEEGSGGEWLRIWDPCETCVILGRGSKVDREVDPQELRQNPIPIYRRVSGGTSVLLAPGCLLYAVVLSLDARPHLRMLDQAHQFVMGALRDALQPLQPALRLDGTCDLVLGNRKVSGNSVRITRDWMLYHGTLLLSMPLDLVSRYLQHPPREPDYRQGRRHHEFLQNIGLDRQEVSQALQHGWGTPAQDTVPEGLLETLKEHTQRLVEAKYSRDAWNLQR